MSDETKAPDASKSDELTNLKQEMSRKLGNYESKLNELAQTNQQLLQKLSQLTQPKPISVRSDDDDMDKLWYDDPKKAAAKIKEQTKAEIMAEYQRDQEMKARTQSTLAALVADYPELNDSNSELTRRAVEIYNGMADGEKTSPIAYKAAVREAASELGVLPVKKRQVSDDDSYTGSSSSSSSNTSRRAAKKDDLDPRTIAFAKLVGLNIDDDNVKNRVKERAKRTNWSKYE